MAERREYRLTLGVRSPFMFQGLANARFGVDSAFLRNEDNLPVIPQTQIRGVLRAALEQRASRHEALLPDGLVDRLFGRESLKEGEDDARNRPARGAALFSDLVGEKPADGLQTTRIAIDDATGAVTEGAMQVVELAQPFGMACRFEGTIAVTWPEGSDIAAAEAAFRKALKLIPAIGAFKSSGFGEVIPDDCRFDEVQEKRRTLRPALPHGTANPGWKSYALSFDRPIVVDSARVDNNLFQSAGIVPGGVMKGALAASLASIGYDVEGSGALAEALSAARFSHAFPLAEGTRVGLPIPFSVVADGDGRIADLGALELGRTVLMGGRSALFAVDGKQAVQKNVRTALSLPDFDLEMVSRTHVKIDAETVSAVDQNLFSLSMVSTRGTRWRFDLDTGRVADPAAAAFIHEALRQGLDGVGRTGASALVETLPGENATEEPKGAVTLMLATAAILFDPVEDPDKNLAELYRNYVSTHLGGARLETFFARTQMAGGYLGSRFRAYGSAYYPFVLTRPGSVFRLECPTEAAQKAVGEALRYGLPVPRLGGADPDWRTCPFMSENGYGALMPSPSAMLPLPPDARIVGGSDVR